MYAPTPTKTEWPREMAPAKPVTRFNPRIATAVAATSEYWSIRVTWVPCTSRSEPA